MDEISTRKIKQYREIFEMFDRDKDGSLTIKELREVINKTLMSESINKGNFNIESEENTPTSKIKLKKNNDDNLEEILSEIDIDGNSKIDFEEFIILMHRRTKDEDSLKLDLINAFKIFDKDNDKLISNEELLLVLTSLGQNLSEEEIHDIIEEADADKDGHINYEEFVEFLLNNN